MNTIVVNTLSGAVSEYTNFAFDSITPNYAGSATGLYALGGDLDVTAPIVSTATTGKSLLGGTKMKFVDGIYVAMSSAGSGRMTVVGENGGWSYDFTARAPGVSRVKPGKGIRENYLAFSYSNPAGGSFVIDSIEAVTQQSTTRKV